MNTAGEDSYFYLKWNDFDKQLSYGFSDLFRTQDLVDTTLCCEGQTTKAHKIVLAMNSLFFRQIFKDHPHKNPIVIINGIKFNDLKNVLEFIYHGQVNVIKKEIPNFIAAAELLKIDGISTQNSSVQFNSNSSVDHSRNKIESKVEPTSQKERETLKNSNTPSTITSLPSKNNEINKYEEEDDLVITQDTTMESSKHGPDVERESFNKVNKINDYEPIVPNTSTTTYGDKSYSTNTTKTSTGQSSNSTTNMLRNQLRKPPGIWAPPPPFSIKNATTTKSSEMNHPLSSNWNQNQQVPNINSRQDIINDNNNLSEEYQLSINTIDRGYSNLQTFTTPSGMVVTSTMRRTDDSNESWSLGGHSSRINKNQSVVPEPSHLPQNISRPSAIQLTSRPHQSAPVPVKKRFSHGIDPLNVNSIMMPSSSSSSLEVVSVQLGEKGGDNLESRLKTHKQSQVPLAARYTTAEVDALVDSVGTHTGPFVPCQICDKLVKRERLRAHIHECHLLQGQRLICPYCSVALKSKGSYRVHVWRHRKANAFSARKVRKTLTRPSGS